jgi:hypothetical protein
MSRPSSRTEPRQAGNRPMSALTTVDLPAPFVPMIAVIASRAKTTSTSRTIGTWS